MKLTLLNEERSDNPIKLDYSSIVASFFTKGKGQPNMSFALEPKVDEEDEEDKIDSLEDTVGEISATAKYGRSSNTSRANTGGGDEVLGGK